MVARSAGNISGEATTQRGNIFNEAMRHYLSANPKNLLAGHLSRAVMKGLGRT